MRLRVELRTAAIRDNLWHFPDIQAKAHETLANHWSRFVYSSMHEPPGSDWISR
jgi:hypothetical protein